MSCKTIDVKPGSASSCLSLLAGAALVILAALTAPCAMALNLTVTGVAANGDETPVGSYRWQIEEDTTYHPEDGGFSRDPDTLGLSFHTSYTPVVANGDEVNITDLGGFTPDARKHYFISVLPDSGYSIGGTRILPGQADVTVHVQANPLPTAQITVFVFEDNYPVNNAPDLPEETPCVGGNTCMDGFTIQIEDAGGRYGASAGRQSQDAFGNPIGSTYVQNPDGTFVFDGDGNPTLDVAGTGVVTTGPDGRATIKYLAPGKYGVLIVPPVGQQWQQTTTIEGTKVIDAWVKADEPPFFAEFGPPGEHVFAGFIRPFRDAAALTGGATISGTIVNNHMSRPPDYTLYNGGPLEWTTPWVALNDLNLGAIGKGIYAQPTSDGAFTILGVPDGDYQLSVFDKNLDMVIALLNISVVNGKCSTPTGSCNLQQVPVFNWFARFESRVFNDLDADGFRDAGEAGIPEMGVNLRWRDGTLYQAFATDIDGFAPFDQVFPFFHWLVAEVDFASALKATGATFVVDAGGAVQPDGGWDTPSFGQLTPQPQCVDDGTGTGATVAYDPSTDACQQGDEDINPNTGNNLSRTESGVVLTQGFQAFLGQTNVIEWGKTAYGHDENGGISGVVFYSTTRAEDDPELGAAEPWEPGIPRVTVNLYQDANNDGEPDGEAILTTTTDSWDDSLPTGCQGENFPALDTDGVTVLKQTDCYDGLRNFNQLRPAVFDGGYAFGPTFDCAELNLGPGNSGKCPDFLAPGADGANYLVTGSYIVEVVPPPGYKVVQSQDKNVDFGDGNTPSTLQTPAPCVGAPYTVPAQLSLFPGVDAPLAGASLPLCDRKQVELVEKYNAAADFFLFTEVPIAGHFVGMILDDTANEFDPASPQFGEKYAAPFMPVSFRDWTGREVTRVYSDEWGRYNGLVASTFTENLPQPSGISPAMYTACMNDPGPVPDPDDPEKMILDPQYNRQYSQFCYTFQYMPGTTTYLDTPVVPVAAFAGPNHFQLDCSLNDGTPRIYEAHSGTVIGPYISGDRSITIQSVGDEDVPNPLYDGPYGGSQPQLIPRDFGFGDVEGTVTIGGVPLQISSWDNDIIVADVPAGGSVSTGQLVVTRGDNGRSTQSGLTVWVEPDASTHNYTVHQVLPSTNPEAHPIQDAIDAAEAGDLILVGIGNYPELVTLNKPVRLQGAGEATVVNGSQSLSNRLLQRRADIEFAWANNLIDLLPSQEANAAAFGGIEPEVLFTEEGATILVLAKNDDAKKGGFGLDDDGIPLGMIDGLTVTGASGGGGIMVNGYANDLRISNNYVVGNEGFFGGGIRVGHPFLGADNIGVYDDAMNDGVTILRNRITQNGGLGGAGGGLSLHTGADDYEVRGNFICGNFSLGEGGGIGHMGLADDTTNKDGYGGIIAANTIQFNQTFNQGAPVTGGGIFVSGGPPADPAALLSAGSGSVLIEANLILGNLAGAGDGGGISLLQVNGEDVAASNNPENWFTVDLFDNIIVNNVAGLAGGAIAMKDVVRSNILHNTIANNDSTATAGGAFTPGDPNQSNPQPGGIVSRAHDSNLTAAFPKNLGEPYNALYANPLLVSNTIRHNRSFYIFLDDTVDPNVYGLVPDAETADAYWDLAVLGTPGALAPLSGILTSLDEVVLTADGSGGVTTTDTGHDYDTSNLIVDPSFIAEYFNGSTTSIQQVEIKSAIQVQPALDEGGNFVDVRFGPLSQTCLRSGTVTTPCGDYHIDGTSPAIGAGDAARLADFAPLADDIDGDARGGGAVDVGADEYVE